MSNKILVELNIHNGHIATCNCCRGLAALKQEHLGDLKPICRNRTDVDFHSLNKCGHSSLKIGATCGMFEPLIGDEINIWQWRD